MPHVDEFFAPATLAAAGLAVAIALQPAPVPVIAASPMGIVCVGASGDVQIANVAAGRVADRDAAEWVGRPFFAKYDEEAVWLSQLEPLAPDTEHFYEAELQQMLATGETRAAGVDRRRPAIFGHVEWE